MGDVGVLRGGDVREGGTQFIWLSHCRGGEDFGLSSCLLRKSGPESGVGMAVDSVVIYTGRGGCFRHARLQEGISELPGEQASTTSVWKRLVVWARDSGAVYRSRRSTDEDEAGPWPQRNWALMQHISVDRQQPLAWDQRGPRQLTPAPGSLHWGLACPWGSKSPVVCYVWGGGHGGFRDIAKLLLTDKEIGSLFTPLVSGLPRQVF